MMAGVYHWAKRSMKRWIGALALLRLLDACWMMCANVVSAPTPRRVFQRRRG